MESGTWYLVLGYCVEEGKVENKEEADATKANELANLFVTVPSTCLRSSEVDHEIASDEEAWQETPDVAIDVDSWEACYHVVALYQPIR